MAKRRKKRAQKQFVTNFIYESEDGGHYVPEHVPPFTEMRTLLKNMDAFKGEGESQNEETVLSLLKNAGIEVEMPIELERNPQLNRLIIESPNETYYMNGKGDFYTKDYPEGTIEHWFQVKVVTGAFKIECNQRQSQLQSQIATSQLVGETKGMPKLAHELQALQLFEIAGSIEAWSFQYENGAPIPISPEGISQLEPGWIVDLLIAGVNRVNKPDPKFLSG